MSLKLDVMRNRHDSMRSDKVVHHANNVCYIKLHCPILIELGHKISQTTGSEINFKSVLVNVFN